MNHKKVGQREAVHHRREVNKYPCIFASSCKSSNYCTVFPCPKKKMYHVPLDRGLIFELDRLRVGKMHAGHRLTDIG